MVIVSLGLVLVNGRLFLIGNELFCDYLFYELKYMCMLLKLVCFNVRKVLEVCVFLK